MVILTSVIYFHNTKVSILHQTQNSKEKHILDIRLCSRNHLRCSRYIRFP